ncbi:hypothetical protein LguiB_029860 [Lonicera macranthoides]
MILTMVKFRFSFNRYRCTGTTMSLLVAVVNPNKQAVEKWDATNNISMEFNSLCNNSKVKEYIL